jgi:nickel/cobalt exporter
VAAVVLAGRPAPASAHPLGNFTVNTYAGLHLSPGRLTVDYVLDLAEIPTFQERSRVDRDGDGRVSADELSAWAEETARRLAGGLRAEVDGRPLAFSVRSARAELLPGQGGLFVLRLEATIVAPAPPSGVLRFSDSNFAGRIGWREVTAVGEDGRRVTGASVPAESVSQRLRSYPTDLLSRPLRVTEATLRFEPGAAGPRGSAGPGSAGETLAAGEAGRSGGAFAALVAVDRLSPAVVALALLAALGLGAVHALAPGHGKTLVAGYLVGAEAPGRQVVGAALSVALMHTASVLALGLALAFAERAFPAERLYPWLGLASGLVAVALGVGLVAARRPGHAHGHGLREGHDHRHSRRRGGSRGQLVALALSGGALPSPTAVVVLLGAVALHRTAFGLALVGAFGLGLAASLLAVGALAARARGALAGRLSAGLASRLPLAGAAAIVVAGAVLTARAASQLV